MSESLRSKLTGNTWVPLGAFFATMVIVAGIILYVARISTATEVNATEIDNQGGQFERVDHKLDKLDSKLEKIDDKLDVFLMENSK